MARKTSRLAARFKAAVEEAEQRSNSVAVAERTQAQLEEAERQRRLAAREQLLDDLVTFADELGILTAARTEAGVTLSRGEFALGLLFTTDPGLLLVDFDSNDDNDHIKLDGEGWSLVLHSDDAASELPLFDDGLEELMVVALGLPRPEDDLDTARPPSEDDLALAEDDDLPPRAKVLAKPEDLAPMDEHEIESSPSRPQSRRRSHRRTAVPGSAVRELKADPFS